MTSTSPHVETRLGVCNLCEAICGLRLTLTDGRVTGVRRIHHADDDVQASDLAASQARRSLASTGLGIEDIDLLGPVLLRQVEEAQQKIILVIRRLEDAGDIVLRRGNDDEYVV